MRIRIAGFNHPLSDKSLVYREVKNIGTLFKLIKNAIDKGANLFSIRILESSYTCPKCKDQELIPLPVGKIPPDDYYCHYCNKSFEPKDIEKWTLT